MVNQSNLHSTSWKFGCPTLCPGISAPRSHMVSDLPESEAWSFRSLGEPWRLTSCLPAFHYSTHTMIPSSSWSSRLQWRKNNDKGPSASTITCWQLSLINHGRRQKTSILEPRKLIPGETTILSQGHMVSELKIKVWLLGNHSLFLFLWVNSAIPMSFMSIHFLITGVDVSGPEIGGQRYLVL